MYVVILMVFISHIHIHNLRTKHAAKVSTCYVTFIMFIAAGPDG